MGVRSPSTIPLMRRSSIGLMPSRSASSLSWDSIANATFTTPKLRIAPLGGWLVKVTV